MNKGVMHLTQEQQDILDGKKGEVFAKIMKTLVMYGSLFGAESMEKVTGTYNHLVTSVGVTALKPVYDLIETLIDAGAVSSKKFTADPRPMDDNMPCSFLQNLVFKKFMFSRQESYEKQLQKLGLLEKDAFTCACYLPEVGNIPKMGDVLSWSESSAVVYANSVLGARCNRNSGILDLMGAIVGYVPKVGLLTDEGRKASWKIDVRTTSKPEAQLLGSCVGMKVMEDVPYITGLDRFFDGLNDEARTYLKDFGAATASNGAVGLYHVEGLTPEAVQQGQTLLKEGYQTFVITDETLKQTYDNYPVVWKNKDAKPKLCFIGCPHMTLPQLVDWTHKVDKALKEAGNKKVCIPTVFTTAPAVIKAFKKMPEYSILKDTGVVLSFVCPLMYMENPLCNRMPVITASNKLRTYSTAKYYTNDEILVQITRGGKDE